MSLPGFTADSSVYRTSGHYQMTAGFDANTGIIRPQQACDLECAAGCADACSDLTGREHAQCIISCRTECGCIPPRQVCGPCQCHEPATWSQQCCLPDGTNCSQRPCPRPPIPCTVEDNRICLPPPFDSICWGSCTRSCCRYTSLRCDSDAVTCSDAPC
jgi:hypothetical protein